MPNPNIPNNENNDTITPSSDWSAAIVGLPVDLNTLRVNQTALEARSESITPTNVIPFSNDYFYDPSSAEALDTKAPIKPLKFNGRLGNIVDVELK